MRISLIRALLLGMGILAIVFGYLVLSGLIVILPYNQEHVAQKLSEELRNKNITLGSAIFIRIFKDSSELELWIKNDMGQFDLFRTYPICDYSGKLGPKLKEGDRQSPEGFYSVTREQMKPNSSFHLAFNLGFPNAYDQAHGRTGSFLMVHGNCVSSGCYAMTDRKIEEIYTFADYALKKDKKFFDVHIFPFRMTEKNMNKHANSPWIDYWKNLQEGYRFFEIKGFPPHVVVKEKRYVFE